MKREHIEKIKGYYDSRGEYKKNSQYSGEQGIVYTKAGDNAHWLIIEQKGEIGAEVIVSLEPMEAMRYLP